MSGRRVCNSEYREMVVEAVFDGLWAGALAACVVGAVIVGGWLWLAV